MFSLKLFVSVCPSVYVVCISVPVQEFDDHMSSEGHAANMNVMSAMYHDKNQQLLTKTSYDRKNSSTSAAAR